MKLEVEITLLSPTIISENSGDPNLVGTEKHITANAIRGAIISQYIHHNGLNEDAHHDENFFQFFFSGNILFSNAWIGYSVEEKIMETQPIPFFLQKSKRLDDKMFNLISCNTDQQTSIHESYYYPSGDDIYTNTPLMELSMHHARKNRKAGCSLEGEIYNYEALLSDQTFIGFIHGEKAILESLKNKLPDSFISYFGRSKNTQYGKAKVEIKEIRDSVEISFTNNPILCLLTPAIFYNEYGFPELSKDVVEKYLRELTGAEIKITNLFSKSERMEQFNKTLRCKTPSAYGFRPGTSFVLDLNQNREAFDKLTAQMDKGIGERVNDGFGIFCIYNQSMGINGELNLISNEKKVIYGMPEGDIPDFLKEKIKQLIDKKIVDFAKSEGIRVQESFNTIQNHTISRLEAGLENYYLPKNRQAFPENFIKAVLGQLKQKAQDNIKASTNKHTDLLSFLQEANPIKIPDGINQFIYQLEQKNWQYKMDESVKQFIYYNFWMNFLRSMRKRNQTFKEGR